MSATEPAKPTTRKPRTVRSAGGTQETSANTETSMTEQEKDPENGGKSSTAVESGANGRSEVMALSVKSEKTEDKGAIQVSTSGSIQSRPVVPGELEVAGTYAEAGLRPIGASHMHVYGTILNNRPIIASTLRVAIADALADHRPIFGSDLVVRDDLTLPGGRPVFASDPQLLQSSFLPGGRPIASNEIDDSESLMGYID
ncbi:MAG TPA: hypothetical protein V6C88_15765 [Chroococcidiopsis sp.]